MLEDFVPILRCRLLVAAIVGVLGIVAAPILPRLIPATYGGTARLLVVKEVGKGTSLTSAALPSIVQNTEVVDRVKHRLGL